MSEQGERAEQKREYGVYQAQLGRLVLQGGPGVHWVCTEANTVLKGYVLPYLGEAIAPDAIPDLIAQGWLPSEFQFPIIGYCPSCHRLVDTVPRSIGRTCVVCSTVTLDQPSRRM